MTLVVKPLKPALKRGLRRDGEKIVVSLDFTLYMWTLTRIESTLLLRRMKRAKRRKGRANRLSARLPRQASRWEAWPGQESY